jgi:hypothetical protein
VATKNKKQDNVALDMGCLTITPKLCLAIKERFGKAEREQLKACAELDHIINLVGKKSVMVNLRNCSQMIWPI